MTLHTLNPSAHFVYQWDDTVNGSQQRAAALQGSCETDLARLESLFDEHNGFDNGNTVTILVGNVAAGLASNNGYQTGAGGNITMVAWSAVNPAATADTGARLEFVAEMCEILMSLRNARKGASWNAGGSNGEGLSQYLTEMFYRSGYYDSQLQHGPTRMTSWLNDVTRPDWVTRTDPTDKNFTTFGCAFLFLHFLHTQKGFSVQEIITKGGATLEDTYRNLTGSAGGWNEFSGLLNKFYPARDAAGTAITYAPKRCNLFPLYEDNRRDVSIDVEEVSGAESRSPGGAPVTISPGLLCPKGKYSWEWADPNSHLECTARPKGFGNPIVSWVVNGEVVPSGGGYLTVTGAVDLDQADQPGSPARSTQTFHLTATVADASDVDGSASRLSLFPVEHPGSQRLTIETRITEQYAPGVAMYAGVTWTTLHTHGVQYEPQYYADREACKERWDDFLRRHVRVKVINILLTLPDPPEELTRAARVVEELQHELRRLADIEPEAAAQLGAELARLLQVSPATLSVPGDARPS